jgi:hypothetical protein
VHDYFEILGVSRNARAPEIRLACRRRSHPAHPDIRDDESRRRDARARDADEPAVPPADLSDAAIDFVNMARMVARMRAAFFVEP